MIDSMDELAKALITQMIAQCQTAVPQPIIQTNGRPALVWHTHIYPITQMPPESEEKHG